MWIRLLYKTAASDNVAKNDIQFTGWDDGVMVVQQVQGQLVNRDSVELESILHKSYTSNLIGNVYSLASREMLVGPTQQASGEKVTCCYVTDPEGNIIELQSWA